MDNPHLGNEPAFPVMENIGLNGMSKRFYAACAAMQAILSGNNGSLQCDKKGDPTYPQIMTYNFKKIATNAYLIADELLKIEQENETNN